jgi:polysaccharide biosynthesis transport protein
MQSTDQLLVAIWRRRLLFVTTFIVVMAAVAAITYSLPKVYTTSSYLLVSTLKPTSGAFEAQQVSQVDTQTVSELLQTRNAANTVAQSMPYPITAAALQSNVSISPVAQTELVLIKAHGSTPLRAQQLANAYANVFAQQAPTTITSVQVTVAEPAALVTNPSAPRPKLYLAIGAILALLLAAGVALLRQRLDQRLVIDDFATELLGIPILARIPEVRDQSRVLRLDAGEPSSPGDVSFIEGFRLLFANLAFVGAGGRPATIAVVSPRAQDGKSTVCAEMAKTATEMTASVLLVDGDLRRPSLFEKLDTIAPANGLSNFLAGGSFESDDVSELIQDVPGTDVRLVGSGPSPPNPSSLLGLPSLDSFMQSVKRTYDLVIFDSPPISAGADASLIAAHTEAAIIVVDARSSGRASVEWSLEQLKRARVNVVGVVVNRVSGGNAPASDYYGYGSGRVTTASPDAERRSQSRPATSRT